GVFTRCVGDHQVEVGGAGPVRGGGGGREARFAGLDPVAGRVLQRGVGHIVLQGVGQFDIADRAVDLLHVRSRAFVALAADALGPLQLGAFTDPALPLRVHLGQVVAEVEGGAGAIGAVDDADFGGRQVDVGVEPGDCRIIPGGDIAHE